MSQATDLLQDAVIASGIKASIERYKRDLAAANVSDGELCAFLGQTIRQAESDLCRYAVGGAA